MICLGIGTGLLFQYLELGGKGVLLGILQISVPIIVLYLLFLMRALGAGDIKLFSVIGSLWNFKLLFWCVVFSFLAGAIWSLGKMMYHRNVRMRLLYFVAYLRKVLEEKALSVYDVPSKEAHNFIHFSIPMFIGYLIAMGVVY
ncbi:hypothetical protein FACS1894111_08280 [Clostridia bacterium]|nr:hypothetical protein FACS1894111_08280 [Clostridia bacterium]